MCVLSPLPQGDFPWDDKDFRYMAVTAAGVVSLLLYFYWRDTGREISWKEFVHRYVSRGEVRTTEQPNHSAHGESSVQLKSVRLSRWNV